MIKVVSKTVYPHLNIIYEVYKKQNKNFFLKNLKTY